MAGRSFDRDDRSSGEITLNKTTITGSSTGGNIAALTADGYVAAATSNVVSTTSDSVISNVDNIPAIVLTSRKGNDAAPDGKTKHIGMNDTAGAIYVQSGNMQNTSNITTHDILNLVFY